MTDLEIRKPYLSKRNTRILDLWNTGEHTYESIGDIYHVSRERVRQILGSAKRRGFEVTDVNDVSKTRAKSKLLRDVSRINADDFKEAYLNGISKGEAMTKFDINNSAYDLLEEKLLKGGVISYKDRVIKSIKDDIENVDEITRHRESVIKLMRGKNKTYQEIQDVLGISKPRLSQIIRRMKDKGIDIPNSRISGGSLPAEEIMQRVNAIEECLDNNMNQREISHVLGITEQTIKKLIYKHLT